MQENDSFPFEIKRLYYTHHAESGSVRGSHAHRTSWQLFICLNGEVELKATDSVSQSDFRLSSPEIGLLIPPMIWTTQREYSSNTLCLIVSSEIYSEKEYIRNYDEFIYLHQSFA